MFIVDGSSVKELSELAACCAINFFSRDAVANMREDAEMSNDLI